MTVCLVRCPAPFLIDERCFPPLGLMAVGAGLRRRGVPAVLYDGDWDSLPLDYSHYGFGPTAPEYPAAVQAMRRIKDDNPFARVVLGGPHATLNFGIVQRDGWDCVVVGDGEMVGADAFLGTGRLIHAPELPLDDYPLPDRRLVNLSMYHYLLRDRPATTLMTGRGCPYRCDFCGKNNTRVRLRSAGSVLEEVRGLQEDWGYHALLFPEDIFILRRARAEQVARYLQAHHIIWRCLVRADLIVRYGAEFVQLLADSGCVSVGMGVESGSDKILAGIHKGETVADIRNAIRLLKHFRIDTKGYFIVGLPGETPETLAETEAFLRDVELDDIDVTLYQPYPGSRIYSHREEYDIQWQNVPLSDTFYKGRPTAYRGCISTSAMTTDELVAARDALEAKYKKWDVCLN